MFKIIEGTGALKKPEINKPDLYSKAYMNTLKLCGDNLREKSVIKKLIVYGVKATNSYDFPKGTSQEYKELAELEFQQMEIIKMLMGTLTPGEFIFLFPISKDYDGCKIGVKDYFYVMDYIRTLDTNKPIGTDIEHFLWEYMNREINEFMVHSMGCLSDLRRFQGQTSLFEEFAANAVIKTYTINKDPKGRKFIIDNETCKSQRVKKAKPRYIRVVK